MATKKPVKKTTKATVKKRPVIRTAAKKKAEKLRSFRMYRDSNFFEFKISRQTVYWTALVSFIILMQLWILKVQFEVIQATDYINMLISS